MLSLFKAIRKSTFSDFLFDLFFHLLLLAILFLDIFLNSFIFSLFSQVLTSKKVFIFLENQVVINLFELKSTVI